jgi:3',5'-cyclic AMP phosphodiesterase CpdA
MDSHDVVSFSGALCRSVDYSQPDQCRQKYMRLIHITDPHLSSLDSLSFTGLRGKRRSGYLSWRKKRRHVYRPEILEQLTAAVKSHQPDLVLLTGDLIQIGLESEMVEAADWLSRLGPPEKVMLIPGNHDNYTRDSLVAMHRHWGGYLPTGAGLDSDYTSGYPVKRETQDVSLLGVNTSCVTRMFSATGELGKDQRQRLARTLVREPGDNRFQCLLIHHPPLPGMTERRKALRDSGQLKAILDQHPPDLVLYGHLHCNREHLVGNTRIFCTASAASIYDASYRIFDVEQENSGWQCRMRVVTRESGPGLDAPFNVVAESCWQSPACASPANTAQ